MRHNFLLPLLLASCAVHAASASFTAANHTLQCGTGGKPDASWSGACKEGLADGPGVAEWLDDDGKLRRFDGTLADGAIAGIGDMMLGGTSYNGTFLHFAPGGTGFFKYASGTLYEGGVVDGKPHGQGVMQAVNGMRYKGDWVAGQPEGNGRAAFALGGSYDGQWRNYLPHGLGTIVYAGSGRTFTGQFVDGHVADAATPATAARVMQQIHGNTRSRGSMVNDVVGETMMSGAPWADMSESECQAYRQQYDALEAGDEPPYPAKGMRPVIIMVKKVHDAFPTYKGPVRAHVLVGPDGQAESVKTFGAVPTDIIQYVSGALLQTTYKPAGCQGTPCRMPFSVAFVLQ